MITLLFAAAAAAAQPATSPTNPAPTMQMGQAGEHKGMDCCKDCSKDMAKEHDGQPSEHKAHNAH